MPPEVYDELLERVRQRISLKDTNWRECISAERRLNITLRYLALGDSYLSLAQQFRVSRSGTGGYIQSTCEAIYAVLKDEYLKMPQSAEEWESISREFEARWNFPNACGAIDGKHVAIMCPPNSGSYFYNYKGFYSLVLLAIVDADYQFIYIDVGSEGRANDASIWRQSSFYRKLNAEGNPLHFPPPRHVRGIEGLLPYFLLGDDAFALTSSLMKPISKYNLNLAERVYNYRVSRGRLVVENAFGIMCSKFRILRQTINMHPDNAEKVILACVVLHNYLRRKCGQRYMATPVMDGEDDDHLIIPGEWRTRPQPPCLQADPAHNMRREAKEMRQKLMEYFMGPEGEVYWQYRAVLA